MSMTESEKINGWTFEETVKTAENLMEAESNMFKWDVLRHLRDFAEAYKDKVQQFEAIGTIERFKELTENNNRIIEILRTHRFTDEECIEEIAKIVGVYSQRLEYKGKSVGKWVFKNDGAYGKRSGIGGIESNQKKPFCPNCGAEMQE